MEEVLGETSLPLVPRSASRARSFAQAVLGGRHPALDDVRLLVSEVVTSALVYAGGGSINIVVTEGGDVIRVDAIDWSAATPPKRGEPGWILFLVDLIAHRWGVWEGSAGTSTWFEVKFGLHPGE